MNLINRIRYKKYINLLSGYNDDYRNLNKLLRQLGDKKEKVISILEKELMGKNPLKYQPKTPIKQIDNLFYGSLVRFAFYINGAHIDDIEDFLIQKNNEFVEDNGSTLDALAMAETIYNFAYLCHDKGIDLNKLEEAINSTGNEEYIEKFNKDFNKANIENE